jgi:hypothetical protein
VWHEDDAVLRPKPAVRSQRRKARLGGRVSHRFRSGSFGLCRVIPLQCQQALSGFRPGDLTDHAHRLTRDTRLVPLDVAYRCLGSADILSHHEVRMTDIERCPHVYEET